MDMHDIFHVARYEGKFQRREWLFGVLLLLGVIGIPLLQFSLQSYEFSPKWNMVTLPGAMPFVNAYLFNIVQSLLIAFVGTNLLERKQPEGSTACLWTRSFDNSAYCTGKFIGIIGIFMGVNMVSMIGCALINLFYSYAPFNLWHYLFYLITLNFPTLIFLTGLAFWFKAISHSHFFTSCVLLFTGWLSFSPFAENLHGLPDVLGIRQANLISDITGHVNPFFYTMHRLLYFLAGIGFFLASVSRFKRIPSQSTRIYTISGYTMLLIGATCGIMSEAKHEKNARMRESYRKSFKIHYQPTSCSIKEHNLTVEQKGQRLRGKSRMTLYNPDTIDLKQIVLYLNPALEVKSVRQDKQHVAWKRDKQVLIAEVPLKAKSSIALHVVYEGEIDDRYCALNQSEKRIQETSRGDVLFRFGRRHAFLSDTYLLLTPSCGWYPTAIPSENIYSPISVFRDFTRFHLNVVNPKQKVILSQGVTSRKKESDTIQFTPSKPLEGITLCGGNYDMQKVQHKGVTLQVYYFKGHDLLERFWPKADREKIGQMYVDLLIKNDRSIADAFMNGPFMSKIEQEKQALKKLTRQNWVEPETPRLLIVETPLAHDPFWEEGKLSSERVQPGFILLPERLVGFPIRLYTPTSKKRMLTYYGNEQALETSLARTALNTTKLTKEIETISPLLRLFKKSGDLYGRETATNTLNNTCHTYPLISTEVDVLSTRYPYFDIALKTLYRSQQELTEEVSKRVQQTAALEKRILSNVPHDGIRTQQNGQLLLRERRFEEVLRDSSLSEQELENVIFLKAREFLTRLNCPYKKFFDFLEHFYSRHQYQVGIEVFLRELKDHIGIDAQTILQEWANSRHNNRYIWKEVRFDHFSGNMTFLFSAKVYNPSNTPGIMELQYEDAREHREIFVLPARSAREIRWVGKAQISDVTPLKNIIWNLGHSLHVPSLLTIKANKHVEDFNESPHFTLSPLDTSNFSPSVSNEYIIDNEDPGFRVIESGLTLLRQLREDPAISGTRWKKNMNSRSHGETIRSFHAKRGGDGRSKVEWNIDLPKSGRYEVKAFVYHNQSYYREDLQKRFRMIDIPWQKESVKFQYIVQCGTNQFPVEIETINSQEQMSIAQKGVEEGIAPTEIVRSLFYTEWVSLGIYNFPKGKTKVILSDKGDINDIIIADAVKWVRVEER